MSSMLATGPAQPASLPLPRPLLWALLLALGLYSAYAVWQVGVLGIFQAGLANPGALQILLDLVVMALLMLGLMWRDARATGRRFWPYAVLTLAAGSFGPLAYWLMGPARRPGPAVA